MLEILCSNKPINLPRLTAKDFAGLIRKNDAKLAFDVDLVGMTVAFATGAHRNMAAKMLHPPT